MAIRNRHLYTLFFILFICSIFPAHPQDTTTDAGSEFIFKYGEDKNPKFIQKICWEGSRYALKYHFKLKDQQENILVSKYTEIPNLECSLKAGDYLYQITTYNILGQVEDETGWIPLTIEKAYLPVITSVSLTTLYIEKYYGDPITIYGKDFTEKVTVHLKDLVAPDRPLVKGKVKERENGKLVVLFKTEELTKGTYNLVVTNPGNVYASKPFEVRYVKPVDILVSAGYSPFINAYTGDFNQLLLNKFYPVGFKTDLSVFPFKTKYGFFGLGNSADISYFEDTQNVSLYGLLFKNSLTIDYLYQFNRVVGILPKIGGGVVFTAMLFDYGSETLNRNMMSIDPYFTTGVAVQIRPYRFISLLIGVDYSQIFYNDSTLGMVKPYISAGYQF